MEGRALGRASQESPAAAAPLPWGPCESLDVQGRGGQPPEARGLGVHWEEMGERHGAEALAVFLPAPWESVSLWKARSEALHSLIKVLVTPSLWTLPRCKELREMGKGKRRELETNFEQLSKFGTLWVDTGNEVSSL